MGCAGDVVEQGFGFNLLVFQKAHKHKAVDGALGGFGELVGVERGVVLVEGLGKVQADVVDVA